MASWQETDRPPKWIKPQLTRLVDEARRRGRTLLTFDTMSGSDAERVYLACGCTKVGEIPGYALWPDGSGPSLSPDTVSLKRLA